MNNIKTVIATFRLKYLLLTPICIALGLSVVKITEHTPSFINSALVLFGALCAHASVNAFNEYFDFDSGLDNLTQRTPFSGGTGSLPANPSAKNAVLIAACITLSITIIIGLYLMLDVNPRLLPIGLLGVYMIIAYTRIINRFPWLCLMSAGLAFGPMFVTGTYIAVISPQHVDLNGLMLALITSLIPFYLVNNLLLLNQLPDVDADKQVGRNTFPIRYGLPLALKVFKAQLLLSAVLIALPALFNCTPTTTLLALIPLILGFNAHKGIKNAVKKAEGHNIKATVVGNDKITPYLGQNVACVLLTILVYALTLGWFH